MVSVSGLLERKQERQQKVGIQLFFRKKYADVRFRDLGFEDGVYRTKKNNLGF